MKSLIPIILCALLLYRQVSAASLANCNSPATWNGRRCNCPANMVMVNGKCACDYGYSKVGSDCKKCDDGGNVDGRSCAGSQNACQELFRWNGAFCEFDWSLNNCQKDEYWNGLTCVKLVYPITCQNAFAWNGQACLLALENRCQDNNFFNGKNCVSFVFPPKCESGFSWNGQVGHCLNQKTNIFCEANKYWNGQDCVDGSSSQSCVAGNYWNGKDCSQVLNPPMCQIDTLWAGFRCKPKINNAVACDAIFSYNNRTLSCQFFLCDKGQFYNPATGRCQVQVIPLDLTAGLIPNLPDAQKYNPKNSQTQGGTAIAGAGTYALASSDSFSVAMMKNLRSDGQGYVANNQQTPLMSVNTDDILTLLNGLNIQPSNSMNAFLKKGN